MELAAALVSPQIPEQRGMKRTRASESAFNPGPQVSTKKVSTRTQDDPINSGKS